MEPRHSGRFSLILLNKENKMNNLETLQKQLICKDLLEDELSKCDDVIDTLLTCIVKYQHQIGERKLKDELLNEIAKGLSGTNK
jgi:hypothetical protein